MERTADITEVALYAFPHLLLPLPLHQRVRVFYVAHFLVKSPAKGQ